MLLDRIRRLLGAPPPPCGWKSTPPPVLRSLPPLVEFQLAEIRWSNMLSALSIAADLEALEYLPRESITPANDVDPEMEVPTTRLSRSVA